MSKRSRQSLAFSVLSFLTVAFLVFAAAAEAQSQKGAKAFVAWPASDLKWEALPGGPPGPMIAKLWGDPTKSAYGAIEKVPAGFSAPLHTHSGDHKVVVVSGTWIHGEPGKPDVRLGPGSYLFQPANQRHTTACDAASECVFFIESSKKFDLKLVEEKAAAK
jgi:quercetin dioxygenase-like cupin family protein